MVMTVEPGCYRNGWPWYRQLLLGACGAGLAFAAAATSVWAHGMDHMDMGQAQAPSAECLTDPVRVACAQTATAAFDSKGRLWLVWTADGHVYVQRSEDRGARFSSPVAVNATSERVGAGGANGEVRPKIAFGADNTVYIVWTRMLAKRFSGEIRFSRSEDGGQHFSPPITVNDDQAVTSHAFVALGVGAGSRVYLAWLDGRDRLAAEAAGHPYTGSALYYAVSRDGGRSFQPNRRLAASTCECCRVALAMDPAGRPVLLWRAIYGDQIRDHSLIAFRDADTPGPIRRVSHDGWRIDACPHHGPGLAVDEDGVIHAAWFDNAPERHGLFYARSMDRGAHFSAPISFGDYDRQAGHPSVLTLGKQVYLVWQEFDGEHTYIQYRRSDDGGRSWTQARQAASTSGWADHPFLVSDGAGVYLSWLTRAEGYRLIELKGTS